jgi:PKD repeat protein
MLSKYKFLLLFLCYSMFSNAQTADVNSGCVPLKVNFTAPAGASTFYWDFKDGASSVLAKSKQRIYQSRHLQC